MKTPYNTGKVQIGCRYEPPRKQPTYDEERLQRALLGVKDDWAPDGKTTLLIVIALVFLSIWVTK